MLLGSERIRRLLANPPPDPRDRLVVSPLLNPSAQLKSGTASIDIRLGQKFGIPQRTKLSVLDHLSDNHESDIELYKEETFVPIGDRFVLHPRQFVLGETLEWIHLPPNLAAYVVGRSSWGRDGLVIATAAGVHPLFSGILTLEIANVGEIPLHLYPATTIAQLFIMEVDNAGITAGTPSVFQMQTAPHSQNALLSDKEIIKQFKMRLNS